MQIRKICFTFVKSNQNGFLSLIFSQMQIKDRIKLIMEDQHMTQQVFADYLQQSPATLSSIFNGRTRPTLNIVESIKSKIPDINTEWLLWGTGEMYISHPTDPETTLLEQPEGGAEPMINFDQPTLFSSSAASANTPQANFQHGVKSTHPDFGREEIKIADKEPRKVTEIRVYYDDQTYETFVPQKK